MDYWNHRVTSNNTGCPTATKQKADVTEMLLDFFIETFCLVFGSRVDCQIITN